MVPPSIQLSDKFNFFVPATVEKAGENGELRIKGICSSKTEDTDGEILYPDGFDFQPLLQSGYFNWNHQAKDKPSAILGRPTAAKVINGGQDFFVEGFLYKNVPEAVAAYNLALAMEQEDPERRLGFSIEGHATERDPINPKRVRKAVISHVAITHCPKNYNTLLDIVKGGYSEPFIEVKESEENQVVKTCSKCDHDQLVDGKCLACGYVEETEKSMDTTSIPLPESVEGTPKPSLKEDQEKNLEKGNAKQSDRILGKTKSGKDIYESTGHKSHYAFDSDDHEDASALHLEEAGMLWKLGKKDEAFVSARKSENHKARAKKTVKSKELKKSEVYDLIFSHYPSEDLVKSEKIYQFVKTFTEKTTNMSEITEDVLSKAFEMLDGLSKSQDKDDLKDYDKKDELIKDDDKPKKKFDDEATEMVKGMCGAGKSEKEISEDMMAKGYDGEEVQTNVAKLCAEYTAKKNGGDVTQVTPDRVEKSKEEVADELIKSLDSKFSSLSTILKHSDQSMKILLDSVNTLIKSNQEKTDEINELKKSIDEIGNAPNQRKSIPNARSVERFEKSQDGLQDLSLSDPADRRQLTTLLFEKAQQSRQNGVPNAKLEKAITDIEIVKSIDNSMIPLIQSYGFNVVQ